MPGARGVKIVGSFATFLGMLSCAQAATSSIEPDSPKVCSSCEEWNAPHEPFRIFGDTYYVGVAGLSSVLIASKEALILLDAALPQSAPLIAANIRKLGFRVEDIRLIVNTHTHYDHAGGIAALQRASGATVAASPASARALEQGEPAQEDPLYALGRTVTGFPAVPNVRVVKDKDVLRAGPLAITAHFTPGHTPGGTTWTWRSCEDKRCIDVVYADSLNAISAPEFRFTGGDSYPSVVETFNHSIAVVAELPCDVLLTPHPESSGMGTKFQARQQQPLANPFIDPQACKAYAANAKRKLDQRIAAERAETR
jgi:metallo-beta-lactamase class B